MALKGVDETIQDILACACAGLADSGAPVCTCSTTIGTPQTWCLGDCSCEDGEGDGQLWANLVRLYRGDRQTGLDAAPTKPCASASWMAQIRLTLARCFPALDPRGELMPPEDRAGRARTFHDDAAALARAVTCCGVDGGAYVEDVRVDQDPQGGCSYLVVMLRVPVSVYPANNARLDVG